MRIRPTHLWRTLVTGVAAATLVAACGATGDDPQEAAPAGDDQGAEQASDAGGDPAAGSDGQQGEDGSEASDGGAADGSDESDGAAEGTLGETGLDDEPGAGDQTMVNLVWPDDSWEIEELPDDPCADGSLSASTFGWGEDYFSCGPTALSLVACKATGDAVTCVQNVGSKKAVRFTSPEAAGFSSPAPDPGPSPVGAVLEDGTTCEHVSHDHMEHADGRRSWLHCGEDSALIAVDEDGREYFDTSIQPWTAEYGEGTEQPRAVVVDEVTYLAAPEDSGSAG